MTLTLTHWYSVSEMDYLILIVCHWVSDIDWYWFYKQEFTIICKTLAENHWDILNLILDTVLNESNVCIIYRLNQSLQRRVSKMATTLSDVFPPYPTSKWMTTIRSVIRPIFPISLAQKITITSALSLHQILFLSNTVIDGTSDVCTGSMTYIISRLTVLQQMCHSVAWGRITNCRITTQMAALPRTLSPSVTAVFRDVLASTLDPVQINCHCRAL